MRKHQGSRLAKVKLKTEVSTVKFNFHFHFHKIFGCWNRNALKLRTGSKQHVDS